MPPRLATSVSSAHHIGGALETIFPLSAIARTAAIIASLLPESRLGLGQPGAVLEYSEHLLRLAY